MSTILSILKSISIDEKVRNYFRLSKKIWLGKTRKARIVIASLAVLVLASQFLMPFGASVASSPRFNFMDNDYETLLLANASKGETNWHDPVTADYGDRISFNVYYHNGMVDTIAKNTKVKVQLPTQASTKLVSTAYIWADNAAQISDTGTVDVNGSTPAVLEYIPGSTMLLANQGLNPKPAAVQLPDGITEGGVNIGDVHGCWDFAGFVVFQAKVKKMGNPDLQIEKYVRNISQNESAFVKENNAKPGDKLEYKVIVKNTGNDCANNVKVKDVLPSKVTYINGSLTKNGSAFSANIFSGYVNLGNLQPGEDVVLTFEVKVNHEGFSAGKTCFENIAYAYADRIDVIHSSATTCVVICVPELSIIKKVRNVSKSETEFVKSNSAKAGDTLEYRIDFANPGTQTAEDVVLKDVIPFYTEYVSGSSKAFIEGQAINISDLISSQGVQIGDLGVHESGCLVFKVKVKCDIPCGAHILTNVAKIWASNVGERVSTARTTVIVNLPFIKIEKTVRNLTLGEKVFVDHNFARPGDVLEYKVYVKNTSHTTATGLTIKDILPGQVSYLSGSGFLKSKTGTIPLSDAIVIKQTAIKNLSANEYLTIYFKVKVKRFVRGGEKLVNTAEVFGDCKIHEHDSAITEIKKPIKIVIEKRLTTTGTSLGVMILAALAIYAGILIRSNRKSTQGNRNEIRSARIKN